MLLFPELGTNVSANLAFGTDDGLLDGCDVVVRLRIENQRVAACPLEGRAAAAAWAADGRLHYWGSTQHAHGVRDALAGMFGLEANQVRVVAPDVGGGFGAKIGASPEEALLPWLARHLGRPMRWGETRTENMLAMGHGRAQVQHVELGGSRDGTIKAFRLTVMQDAGAYPAIGAVLPFMTRMMASGVYDIPKVECNARSFVTTTASVVAYRGAGRPEATAAIERAVDRFAVEIGMDPAEVRRKNLVAADPFPFTTPTGHRVRHRRLRAQPRPGPRGRRLRGAPGRAGPAARGRRGPPARHRPVDLRRGHRGHRRERARPHRGAARRPGDRVHRHLAARPGPRHGVVDARLRGARHPDGRHRRGARRHRPDRRPAGAPPGPARCSSAARRWRRPARPRSTRAARSRPGCSRRAWRTWCSTPSGGCSTSPACRR